MFPKKTLLVGLVLLLGCAGSQEAAPNVIATNVEKAAMAIENRKHRAQEAAEAWQDLVEDLGSNDGLVELPELKQSLTILQKDPTHLQARYNRGRLAKQAWGCLRVAAGLQALGSASPPVLSRDCGGG